MYFPDKETFLKKSSLGNLIPVHRELLVDQDTPLTAYERLRASFLKDKKPFNTFLMESVEGGENVARYSSLGGEPHAIITARGRRVEITNADGSTTIIPDTDPLSAVRGYMSRFNWVPDPSLPVFTGGAIGYLSYDMIQQFENVQVRQDNSLGWPDMLLAIMDTIIVFDRVRQTVRVIANAFIDGNPEQAYQDAIAKINKVCQRLATDIPHVVLDAEADLDEIPMSSSMTQSEFMSAVDRAKEYIRAGDIIQTVLSQRFEGQGSADLLDIYRALRSVNPSPYMFCLEFGEYRIAGSSPELHVRCDDGLLELRPIAGTRPRATNHKADEELAKQLLNDPKERAEHIMLVDLARNDLGRVSKYGSVEVTDLMVIERYSHVMHIVSSVVGKLDPQRDVFDVIRATFPAGTVSGAPKIRAMEIIAELEKSQRGPYAGAICYISFSGNLDSCITIRTVLLHNGKAYIQAGAGIVADSDPNSEYEETKNKARGMIKALALSLQFANAREKTK